MQVVDLHCDSLYESVTQNIGLDSDKLEVKLNLNNDDRRLQCYAIWLPDNLSGEEAESLFLKAHKKLNDECKRCQINLLKRGDNIRALLKQNKYCAYFTVENGSAVNGKLENINKFAQMGVKMITLTWNDSNIIGDGAEVANPKGLTYFGKSVIGEMEKCGIIVDVSHASEKLFYDVAELSKLPFVASHSDSAKITPHKRNLTDEQFKIIAKSGGLVGINFHREFLSQYPQTSNKYDIIRHIDHFLSLGGENTICLGSDFDGCDLPDDISGSDFFSELYELLLRHNYKERQIKKIFCDNALNFFENFDNQRIM